MVNPTPTRKFGEPHDFPENGFQSNGNSSGWANIVPAAVEPGLEVLPEEILPEEASPENAEQMASLMDEVVSDRDAAMEEQAAFLPPDGQLSSPLPPVAGTVRQKESAAQKSPLRHKHSVLTAWFWNLPVGRKLLLAIVVCELVPLIGLGGGATWIITQGLRKQLTEQAKSEVEVTDIRYRIKMDQMALGSRGQSDNSLVLKAASEHLRGYAPVPEDFQRLRRVLGNELQVRSIEYATLVGRDLTIIANANRDRAGELFDPDGLVSTVLRQGRQLQTSQIVSRAELELEGVDPLPEAVEKDSLIRYIVTPIFNPSGDSEVIGALVFGDIVNGKTDIPRGVLKPFERGYSAVYQRDQNDEFSLATSLHLKPGQELFSATENLPIDAVSLLKSAAQNPQETFVERLRIGDGYYTVAARAEPAWTYNDYDDGRGDVVVHDPEKTAAFLVHGTPETTLNSLLNSSLMQGLLVLCLSILLVVIWSLAFRRTLLTPLLRLGKATDAFAKGDRDSRAIVDSTDEVGELAVAFNDMADSINTSESILAEEAQRQEHQAQMAQQLNVVTTQMRSFSETQEIFQAAVDGARRLLEADRAVVYCLDKNFAGTIAAESVLLGWTPILGQEITDPCFVDSYVESYRQGRIHVVENIHDSTIDPCYLKELEPFGIQANLVIPILMNNQLLGLFCLHQCDGPRLWQEEEITFAKQIVTQLGYALEQAQLLRDQAEARRLAEEASASERQQNQALQMQLIELLSDVENVADGDLTIRANVSEGAIGTVADFFNSIVESLRQVVTQVKDSSLQVNASVGESDSNIRQLTQEALRQSEEITSALGSVENMTRSIQSVANSASQAAVVSQTAADTAVAGGVSMDRTVDNILTLRETIGETAKKVKRLGESSQQISKVVYLINQIAMQTNLLAINAGIEAARAGEEGQGFAVVAEEVGELAARSAVATQEIEQIVENIQRETSELVQAMELGTAQVVEGTHLVDDAKQNLGQIVTVSQEINDLVKSISDATVVQADTSESITAVMQKLSAIAQRTSASSAQVSDSLQSTVTVAQQLQESVGTFKVG